MLTTEICPNCKIATETIEWEGLGYEKLLANDNADLAKKFGVKQAPTLVVVKNGAFEKHSGVSDIKKYVNA